MSDDLKKSELDKVDIDDFFGEDAMRPTSIDEFDKKFSAAPTPRDAQPDKSNSEIQLEPTPDVDEAFGANSDANNVKDVNATSSASKAASDATTTLPPNDDVKTPPDAEAPKPTPEPAASESRAPASRVSLSATASANASQEDSVELVSTAEVIFRSTPKPSPTTAASQASTTQTKPQTQPKPQTQTKKQPTFQPTAKSTAQTQNNTPPGYSNIGARPNQGVNSSGQQYSGQQKNGASAQYAQNTKGAQSSQTQPTSVGSEEQDDWLDPLVRIARKLVFLISAVIITWAVLNGVFDANINFQPFCCLTFSVVIFFYLLIVFGKKPEE